MWNNFVNKFKKTFNKEENPKNPKYEKRDSQNSNRKRHSIFNTKNPINYENSFSKNKQKFLNKSLIIKNDLLYKIIKPDQLRRNFDFKFYVNLKNEKNTQIIKKKIYSEKIDTRKLKEIFDLIQQYYLIINTNFVKTSQIDITLSKQEIKTFLEFNEFKTIFFVFKKYKSILKDKEILENRNFVENQLFITKKFFENELKKKNPKNMKMIKNSFFRSEKLKESSNSAYLKIRKLRRNLKSEKFKIQTISKIQKKYKKKKKC